MQEKPHVGPLFPKMTHMCDAPLLGVTYSANFGNPRTEVTLGSRMTLTRENLYALHDWRA